jgi:UDP-N-acetylmuramyl tripeptide synthase
VDFDSVVKKAKRVICTGDRAYDMGVRVKYSLEVEKKFKMKDQLEKIKIFKNLKKAINSALQNIKKDETLYVFPTYSAMLEIRKILTGRKIL